MIPKQFSAPLVEHAKTPFSADVDVTPTAERYVGFFENRHGEQLVSSMSAAVTRRSTTAITRGNPSQRRCRPVSAKALSGVWVVDGDLMLDEAERSDDHECPRSGLTLTFEGGSDNFNIGDYGTTSWRFDWR